jgi:small redox-active disulfide protein 2
MTEEDIRQIKLRSGPVGVVGLSELLEEAQSRAFASDEDLKDFLLGGVAERNFVPPTASEEYAEALLREYKKAVGESVDEEPSGLLEIRILGPGCPNCRRLEQTVREVLAEMNVSADVQHVTKLAEIAEYGIMTTPGLVINGEVKSSGRVLSKEQVKSLIAAEAQH